LPTRRIIKNVLEGFLGTYTSRYSDLRGYWLHGKLPFDAWEYVIDLLALPPHEDTPEGAARQLAVCRFEEQISKSGLDVAIVRSAGLRIQMQPETVQGRQGDHSSDGHLVEFVATAVMDNGHRYASTRTVFVAPHDPDKERRRLPEN